MGTFRDGGEKMRLTNFLTKSKEDTRYMLDFDKDNTIFEIKAFHEDSSITIKLAKDQVAELFEFLQEALK